MSENQLFGQQDGLLGRDSLLADLEAATSSPGLVTLTGPGGVGKTSIAQQLAAGLADPGAFGDSVRWIDLAALADPLELPQAVAAACGLAEQRGVAWLETLVAALRPARMLLVLDTCEHLRAACAALCQRLLAECPLLGILATSREPLALPDERRIAIPPLDAGAAAALFRVRALAHLPAFAADDQRAAIAAICAQLDGMPLAIELAAARVALLSVQQIADRMAQSLRILASREPERPQRQRSLRSVLDWSYGLLSADEQALFRQVAVFAASFDLDAVEAVCGGAEVLDWLAELVDKSLVVIDRRGAVVRYRLHDVVRQYALERLQAAGEESAGRERHLAWVVAMAERAELAFTAAEQDAWTASLLLEHENIRRALRTADAADDAERITRVAVALMQLWNSTSISEGRVWLARGRRTLVGPSSLSVKAWNGESFLAYRQGDYEGMHAAASRALEEATILEDGSGIAAACYRMGIYFEMKGATAASRQHYQRALDLLTEEGDRRGMSQILNGLAHVAKLEDDAAAARQYYQAGLALARAENDRLMVALLLISLANLIIDNGELDAAEAAYAESLIYLQAAKHSSYVLYAVNGLGEIAHYRHDFATAIGHYRDGLLMARELGLKDMEGQFLGRLGHTATQCGDYAAAAEFLSEGLRIYLPLERTMPTACTIHFCADLVARLGYPAQATTLFVASLRAAGSEDFAHVGAGGKGAVLQAQFMAAQAALDPADQALAMADGAALTLGQAAELALSAVYLPARPLPSAPPPELRIFLFGHLRVVRDGRELAADDWVYGKTRDLLLLLLLVDSADKAEIGAALWPEASDAQLKQNFRVAIYHLRRALGRAEWISFGGGRYAFNRDLPAWIDLAVFERAVEQADSDPLHATRHLRTAAALYTADLALGDLDSDLALLRREQLRQQALEVLLALGEQHLRGAEPGAAAAAFRRAIALDGYSEAAARGLMRSLVRLDEAGAALAHYQQFVDLLARELGVAPTPETALLAAGIQAGAAI